MSDNMDEPRRDDDVIGFAAQQMADTIRADQKRAAFTKGLRDLANFFDAYTQVPVPYDLQVMVFTDDRETLAAIAKTSSWEKVWSDSWFSLKKPFGESVTLEIYANRETLCRKVVIGKRIVPARPATEEREEEVTEWVCDDTALLADPRRI